MGRSRIDRRDGRLGGQLDDLVLDRSVAEDHHHRRVLVRQTDELDAADGRGLGLGSDDHRRVAGEVGEQVARAQQHLLEPAVGGREERADLGARSRRRAGRARRDGRRRTGSPCRSGSGPPTCAAGRGSPPARAPPSRCARSPTTRRRPARRRCGSSRRVAPSRCIPARRRRGSPSSVRPASWQSRLPSANASQWSPSMPTWNRCPSSPSRRRGSRRPGARRCSGRCASATPSCSSPVWRSPTSARGCRRRPRCCSCGVSAATGSPSASSPPASSCRCCLIGLWAGALSDRFDRRRLTIITQAAMGVQAIVLGVLDLTDVVNDSDRVRDVAGARHHRGDRQPGPPWARHRARRTRNISRT